MRHLRPTLFDLLAHRAIDYFDNDERDISKPAYTFQIDQASAFEPAADFVTRRFITNDSLSLQHKALLTFQRLIAFHLNDAKPDALIDVDLRRIEFVRRHSVHSDKDQQYFNAVNHIAHQYASTPAARPTAKAKVSSQVSAQGPSGRRSLELEIDEGTVFSRGHHDRHDHQRQQQRTQPPGGLARSVLQRGVSHLPVYV